MAIYCSETSQIINLHTDCPQGPKGRNSPNVYNPFIRKYAAPGQEVMFEIRASTHYRSAKYIATVYAENGRMRSFEITILSYGDKIIYHHMGSLGDNIQFEIEFRVINPLKNVFGHTSNDTNIVGVFVNEEPFDYLWADIQRVSYISQESCVSKCQLDTINLNSICSVGTHATSASLETKNVTTIEANTCHDIKIGPIGKEKYILAEFDYSASTILNDVSHKQPSLLSIDINQGNETLGECEVERVFETLFSEYVFETNLTFSLDSHILNNDIINFIIDYNLVPNCTMKPGELHKAIGHNMVVTFRDLGFTCDPIVIPICTLSNFEQIAFGANLVGCSNSTVVSEETLNFLMTFEVPPNCSMSLDAIHDSIGQEMTVTFDEIGINCNSIDIPLCALVVFTQSATLSDSKHAEINTYEMGYVGETSQLDEIYINKCELPLGFITDQTVIRKSRFDYGSIQTPSIDGCDFGFIEGI